MLLDFNLYGYTELSNFNTKIEIAKKMHASGMEIERIMEFTELTEDDINKHVR